jgi:O-antigen ligase
VTVRVETGRKVGRPVFAALLTLIAVAPLPFGSDRPWAWSLIAMTVGVLLLAWGFSAALSRDSQPRSLRPILPSVALFVAVIAWAAFQTVPIAPDDWRHALWAEAASGLGIPLAAPISLDPAETWTAILRLLSYGGAFLLTFQLCTSTKRSEDLVRVLIVATLIYAGYGLVVVSADLGTVLWYADFGARHYLTSTFLYRNAFATYAALGLLCALAMLFRPSMRRGDLDRGWRFASRALGDYFFARKWVLMLACSILFVAILLTHSRAGLGVTVIGICLFLAIMALAGRRKRYVLASIGIIAIAGVVMILMSGGDTLNRLDRAPVAAAERGGVYVRVLEAIAEKPATGVGYGTFANVFGMHRGEQLNSPFRRAHNTYLENALELGVPAAAALLLAVGWVVIICVSSVLRHRRRAFLPCLGISAVVMVGLHALVDYSLQVPAVALTFAAILGAACAQSLALEQPERPPVERRAL